MRTLFNSLVLMEQSTSNNQAFNTKIQYGSATYALLCFAKSKRTSFGVKEVVHVISGKMRCKNDVMRSINLLIQNNCLKCVETDKNSSQKWAITPEGHVVLKVIASRYRAQNGVLLPVGITD